MDVNQYLEIFLDETKEHLESLNGQILKLEQEPEDVDTINEIFRAAHSLKGMAGTMGYKRMQNLTHDMENVFSEIRNGTMKVKSNLIDTLFQCLDALEEYTSNIQETADEGTNENQQLINQLNEFLKQGGREEKGRKKMANFAIMGFGTVGSGVAEVLRMNADSIAAKLGEPLKLKYILDVRDLSATPYAGVAVKDFSVLENDPDLDVVVESIGGAKVALDFTRRALMAGKHVVTSNKELVASHGKELLSIAREKNVNYLFEASVGGGIPVLRPLFQCRETRSRKSWVSSMGPPTISSPGW